MNIINIDIPDLKGHKDILLSSTLLDLKVVADSYYLLIDSHFMENEETFEKVLILLKGLLNNWIKKTNGVTANDATYLPFDFSDQYLGCFRLTGLGNDKISIDYGLTQKYCGYNISLSKIESTDFILDQNDYSPDTITVTISKAELIKDIISSISTLDTIRILNYKR